jgi:hypothetical protein
VGDASTPSLIAIARKNASGEFAADLERLRPPLRDEPNALSTARRSEAPTLGLLTLG